MEDTPLPFAWPRRALLALLGAALLSERIAPLAIAGGFCILVSIWLVMRRPARDRAAAGEI